MKQLADYLQYMETEDVLAATQQAKTQARTLLEDQGIAMLALLLADVLAAVIRQGTPPQTAETAPAGPSVSS